MSEVVSVCAACFFDSCGSGFYVWLELYEAVAKNVAGFTKPKTIRCVLFQGLLVVSVLGFLIITNSKCIPKLK